MPKKKTTTKKAAPKKTVSDDSQKTLVTKQGLQVLIDEYEHLTKNKRKEVSERLKEAISYGDLSENSEYEDAKNEQAQLEARIALLDQQIKNAEIIKDHKGKKVSKIELGSTVKIHDEKGKKSDVEEYTIVGTTEADPMNHRISNESPIGGALLGAKKGDVVEVKAPGGTVKYKVIDFD